MWEVGLEGIGRTDALILLMPGIQLAPEESPILMGGGFHAFSSFASPRLNSENASRQASTTASYPPALPTTATLAV